MAADGGREAPSLVDELFSQGRRFDFFQAVALLEVVASEATGVGAGGDPSREAVRFASSIRLSSPATPVESIDWPKERTRGADLARRGGQKPLMTVNFMGVAGAIGPLPPPFAELILRRTLQGDTAARDFLDLFNHRLLSIAYRIKKRHRIGLGVRAPQHDDAFRYLMAIVGLGAPALRNRLGPIQDGTAVAHAGLLARETRSMAGLESMLAAHFGVPVHGVPLTGGFYPIDPADVTRIGSSGRNRKLGRETILGQRFWDQEASFELHIGPLDKDDYLRFLPGGDRLEPLSELVRLYVGRAIDFRIRLLLDPPNARPLRKKRAAPPPAISTLGDRPRLGRTAWAGRAWGRRTVVLSPPPASEG